MTKNPLIVFKALCDDKRLRILELLRDGEKCACHITDELEIAQSGLSYHMKILCNSGLVKSRHDGKWTYYKIDLDGSKNAQDLLQKITTINPGRENFHCVCD